MAEPRSTFIHVALLTTLLTAGCGNLIDDDDLVSAGGAAVTRTADGDVSLVFYVCGDAVDTVSVVEDREGLKETEENVVAAAYRSAEPLQGRVTFNLADPGATWTPSEPFVLEAGQGYLISASSQERETNDVYVDAEGVADLDPGRLYLVAAGGTQQAVKESDLVANAKRGCQR